MLSALLAACGGSGSDDGGEAQASDTPATSNATTTTWTKVADELQTFRTNAPTTVRFGVGSTWITKTVNGYAQCTRATFGGDPAVGKTKQCEVANITDTDGRWIKLADELGTFRIDGSALVRYGKGEAWVQKSVSGYAQCVTATFGSDPVVGLKKECQRFQAGSGTPAPETPTTGGTPAAASTTTLDAVRLAQQASFGPTESLVATIRTQGPAAWIAAQMKLSNARYTRGGGSDIHQWTNKDQGYCDGKGDNCWRDNYSSQPLLWDFYRNATGQPDQLRQRVAFALQQIAVVSNLEVEGTYGLRNYHNAFLDNAFGNYRQVLKKVALSPVMGDYLNNANNDKAAPNENFARELLQLFAIGTCVLKSDGTLQGGSCQATYDNQTVRHYAYALTGWTYPAGGKTPWGCWPEGTNCRSYGGDMVPVTRLHDTAERQLLSGVKLAAGHTAPQALEAVLDSLIKHPNAGPFIGKQLIQHLVTSNPSPAYVQRVAQAFASGKHASFGTGQAGDLAATVAAVLLDSEARNSTRSASFGKLREPVLFFTSVLRALGGTSDGDALGWWWGDSVRQHVFRPPSVFNFYPPDYPVPGNGTLVGPAFALNNANTTFTRLNFLQYLVMWGGTKAANSNAPSPLGTLVNLDTFKADATDAAKLVDRLSTLAVGGPLPGASRSEVITAVEAFNSQSDRDNWQINRVRQAAYLIFASPHFQTQR